MNELFRRDVIVCVCVWGRGDGTYIVWLVSSALCFNGVWFFVLCCGEELGLF